MFHLSFKKNRSRWPGRRRRMAAIPIPPNRACPHSCTLTCAHSRLNSKYTPDYHLLGIHHWIVPRSLSSRSPHQQSIFKTYVTRFREVHSFFHLRFENRRMIDFQKLCDNSIQKKHSADMHGPICISLTENGHFLQDRPHMLKG